MRGNMKRAGGACTHPEGQRETMNSVIFSSNDAHQDPFHAPLIAQGFQFFCQIQSRVDRCGIERSGIYPPFDHCIDHVKFHP